MATWRAARRGRRRHHRSGSPRGAGATSIRCGTSSSRRAGADRPAPRRARGRCPRRSPHPPQDRWPREPGAGPAAAEPLTRGERRDAKRKSAASRVELSADGSILTVSVPLAVRRRGGRKQIVTPQGEPGWAPRRRRIDGALVKALARAFRWRTLLDEGVFSSIQEIASAEKINVSYVSRVHRLTLLAPDIVEAILNGLSAPEVTLNALLRPLPAAWEDQRKAFCKTA